MLHLWINFPDTILSQILIEWITLKDLSSFDCALCCHKYRNDMLKIIRSSKNLSHCACSAESNCFSDSFWTWIRNFSVKIEKIKFKSVADLSIFLMIYYTDYTTHKSNSQMILLKNNNRSSNNNICDYIKTVNINDNKYNSQRFDSDHFLMKLGHIFHNIENLTISYPFHDDVASISGAVSITKLKSLALHASIVTDIGISAILSSNQSSIAKLELLACHYINGSNISPSFLTNLTELTISGCKGINPDGLHAMTFGLTGLSKLSLVDLNMTSDDNLNSLIPENLTNLTYLRLSHLNFHGRRISEHLPHSLTELDLSHLFHIRIINEVFSYNLSNLKILKISCVTIGEVNSTSSFPTNLTRLDSNFLTLNEQGLVTFLSFNLIHLRYLNMNNNDRITGEDSMKLLPISLVELHLSGCGNFTEKGLHQLLSQNLSNLTVLNLSGTDFKSTIKDDGLNSTSPLSLPSLPQSLTSLDLSYTRQLTDYHLYQLFANDMTNLTTLDLPTYIDIITNDCLLQIRTAASPSLMITTDGRDTSYKN
eukprot:gene14499-19465_t